MSGEAADESAPSLDRPDAPGMTPMEEGLDPAWARMLQQLACYSLMHGTCRLPPGCAQHPELAAWLEAQMQLYQAARLPMAQVQALMAMGVDWVQPVRAGQAVQPVAVWRRRFDWRSVQNDARWQLRFEQFVAFQREHGHLHVTLRNQTAPGLMHWRDNQRIRRQKGMMTEEQREKLEGIGFEWQCTGRISPVRMVHENIAWERQFTRLLAFREEHGHCDVPSSDGATLAKWVKRQREARKKQALPAERQQRLEEIGFKWEAEDGHRTRGWQRRFEQFRAFKELHGHLHVTLRNQTAPGLMHWRDNQRIRYRQGVMTEEQREKLEGIGFEWQCAGRISPIREVHENIAWEHQFTRLLAFREEHGHGDVPASANPTLAKWVHRQREAHKRQALPAERRQRLEEIGFEWEAEERHLLRGWEVRYQQLVAFKELHGHLHVTLRNQTVPGLMHWRDNQRLRYEAGTMPPDQVARLEALGFQWEKPGPAQSAELPANAARWEQMHARLAAFKQEHGHCRVPGRWPADRSLGQWLHTQRRKFRRGAGVDSLSAERLARLDAVGTEWRSPLPPAGDGLPRWERNWRRLEAFHRLHGHADVPGHPDRTLRKWVLEQRQAYQEGRLDADQTARLEALGFRWETPGHNGRVPGDAPATWEERFAQLQAYAAAHGHFVVPKGRAEFKQLRNWVTSQRVYRRRGILRPAYLERLDAIGFPWNPVRSATPPGKGAGMRTPGRRPLPRPKPAMSRSPPRRAALRG